MALYVGENRATMFHGDSHPLSLYVGNRKISGYSLKKFSGKGRVEIGEQPYKASLPSVTVHGEGKQDKLEGKNLIPFPYAENFKEENGVKFTVNPDGSIKVEGKATARANFFFVPLGSVPIELHGCILSGCPSGGRSNKYTLECRVKTFEGTQYPVDIGDGGRLLPDGVCDSVYISIFPGQDIDLTYYPQIEYGSTPTPYEPYCGGIPAPNPQYPIDPVFLEGASVIGRGKNLYDGKTKESLFLNYGCTIAGRTPTGGVGKIYPVWPNQTVYVKTAPPYKTMRLAFIDEKPTGANIGHGGVNAYNGLNRDGFSEGFIRNTDHKYVIISVSDMDKKDTIISFSDFPYTPYYDLGTAPLPILRALPDGSVRDEMDVVSGTVVRRIGELRLTNQAIDDARKILFAETTSGNLIRFAGPYYSINGEVPICNHYIGIRGSFGRKNGLAYFNDAVKGFDFMDDSITSREDGIAKFKALADAGTPVTVWYALATPIIEHYDPAILRQHPGYTQLIQQGGFREAEIEAEAYVEDTTV